MTSNWTSGVSYWTLEDLVACVSKLLYLLPLHTCDILQTRCELEGDVNCHWDAMTSLAASCLTWQDTVESSLCEFLNKGWFGHFYGQYGFDSFVAFSCDAVGFVASHDAFEIFWIANQCFRYFRFGIFVWYLTRPCCSTHLATISEIKYTHG